MGKIIEKIRQREFDAMLSRDFQARSDRVAECVKALGNARAINNDLLSFRIPRHPDSQHQPTAGKL